MSFVTLKFAVFAAAIIVLYYIVPKTKQWIVLLAANAAFCLCGGIISVLFVTGVALAAFLAARLIESGKNKYVLARNELKGKECDAEMLKKEKQDLKRNFERKFGITLTIAVLIMVFPWLCIKLSRGNFIMPLAISYYTFTAIAYVCDVRQSSFAAEKNFFRFFVFLSFFPQMIEGPFTRYDRMSETLFSVHTFKWEEMRSGLLRMLYGYAKKLIIADNLWVIISQIYSSEHIYAGKVVLLILLLPLQQFCDFSGCMDIAIGFSEVLGIRLPENFRQPIFSKSIDEVWRRWHVTLGAFCRDYIFYPVSLNKKVVSFFRKIFPKRQKMARNFPVYLALMCVWGFMGIWHGFAWKYMIWAGMNFFFILTGKIFASYYENLKKIAHVRSTDRGWSCFCILRTYLLFGLMETVSDGSSAGAAFRMLKVLLNPEAWKTGELMEVNTFGTIKIVVIVGLVLGILVIEILKEKNISPVTLFFRVPSVPRYIVCGLLLYAIILFSPSVVDINVGFAYANF